MGTVTHDGINSCAKKQAYKKYILADAAVFTLFGGKRGMPEAELAKFTVSGTLVSLEPGKLFNE